MFHRVRERHRTQTSQRQYLATWRNHHRDGYGRYCADGRPLRVSQLVELFELAQEFNQNLNRNFMITIIPETIGIAGTLLFGWGLSTAVIFKGLLWFPQLSHVMLPLYKHKDKI